MGRGLFMLCAASAMAVASASRPAPISSQPPFEVCVAAAPWWHVWKLFSSQTAIVDSENLGRVRVQHRSGDSSMASTFGWVFRKAASVVMGDDGVGGGDGPQYEDPLFGCPAPWAKDRTRCVMHFSPFGEACVRIEARKRFMLGVDRNATVTWVDAKRAAQRRAIFLLAAVGVHRAAESLSEAYQLHYAVGMSVGILFSLVLVVAVLASHASTGAVQGNFQCAFQLLSCIEYQTESQTTAHGPDVARTQEERGPLMNLSPTYEL